MRVLLLAGLAAWAAGSCASFVEPADVVPGQDGAVSDELDDDSAVAPEDVPKKDTGNPIESATFTIPFIYKGIVPGENKDKSDLYLVDSLGRNPLAPEVDKPVAITSFSINPQDCQLVLASNPDGTPLSTAPCSCNLGCVVDPQLQWIIVTVEKPSQTGFAMQIGKFNANLEVKMVKGAIFKNIVDVQFAGGFLYFSQTKYCTEANCQFILYRYDLANIPAPESLFLLPPDDDMDYKNGQHITDGHFTASADGSTLVAISPTIRSSRLYAWKSGVLKELDYICPGAIQNGECTGTGSEFSDLDPLVLTDDGKQLLYIVRYKNRLEARVYNTEAGLVKNAALVDTGVKDYPSTTCAEIAFSGWKFNEVGGAELTDGGTALLLLVRSACQPGKKPYTDLYKIPMQAIFDDKVDGNTITNITLNFRGEGAKNTVISGFAQSPDGKALAYTATPRYGADKKTELSDASAKARDSNEVWAIEMSGSNKRQLTFNNKFSAVWLTAVPDVEQP